jgi:Lrp/AsnC family leucine-responsive transcriptional regulator
MKVPNLDKTDYQILSLLEKDAKMNLNQLSDKLNLSRTPIYQRIKKMEDAKIISGYHAKVNYGLVQPQIKAYAWISITRHLDPTIQEFENKVTTLPQVLSCSHVSGTKDYLLEIVVKDLEDYRNFISTELSEIKVIENIESSFVLKEIKASL